MEETTLRTVERNDFSRLAEWLVTAAQAPDQHCLHTWSGQSPAALSEQLAGYWDDSELVYLLALQGAQIVGAMGAEYDQQLGRAWLHGPHAIGGEWDRLVGRLFARLLAELPSGIGQLDAHLNVANVRGRRFYARHDFEERDALSYEFWLVRSGRPASAGASCGPLHPRHHASFFRLYDAIFPAAYYSAERVVAMIGHSHQVFVEADGAEVVGFAVVSVEEGTSIGEVQFLGVRADRRGRGLGRRLLLSAVDWLFDRARVSVVSLNAGEERLAARRLYESLGFQLRFTGVGLHKALPASGGWG